MLFVDLEVENTLYIQYIFLNIFIQNFCENIKLLNVESLQSRLFLNENLYSNIKLLQDFIFAILVRHLIFVFRNVLLSAVP